MTPKTFMECCNILMTNRDINGDLSPLLNDEVYNIIKIIIKKLRKKLIMKEIF